MDKCLNMKPEFRRQIAEILHIQIEVFHYDKILILGVGEDNTCQVSLKTDSKKYDKFPVKSKKSITLKDFIIKTDLKAQSTLYKLCTFFDVQALFSINMDGECVAFMAIGSKIPTFTDRQIDIAHFIANYIGNLLYNDNLLQDLQYFSQRMEQLLNEMGTLHEITHALDSVRNLDSLLEYIMEKSQSVMQTEAASMMLVIEETNELEFKVALGPKGKEVKPFRLPIGNGISGWVAKTGEPVLIPDCYSDSRFDPSFDKRSGFRTRSMLCVPMTYHNKIMGVMSVLNRKDGNPFKYYFTNDGHWNEASNLLVAVHLYRFLEGEAELVSLPEDKLVEELYTYYSAFPDGWFYYSAFPDEWVAEVWKTSSSVAAKDLGSIRRKYLALENQSCKTGN